MPGSWKNKAFAAIYPGLVLVRLCFALWGTGYIHPDEYFQNGEVVARHILGVHTLTTWEWDPHFPVRSILPVWVSTGIPFSIARYLWGGETPPPRIIFAAERLSFFWSSFLLDVAIYYLVQESARTYALILLGSSYVVHTFQVRPFTNALEGLLVAVSLLMLRKLLAAEGTRASAKINVPHLAMLAFVVVCGLFTRITFIAFFLPVVLEVLKWSLRQTRFSLLPWTRLVAPSLLAATLTGFGFVYVDTIYFVAPSATMQALELTPLNFLRYNLLPSNLAEHGLHPRWLHLFINLPMIATPGLLFYAFWAELDYHNPRMVVKSKEKDERNGRRGVVETMQKVFSWVRWSGTTLLSIQPHQEPRFLVPLLVPIIALVVNNGRILRAGRWFWVTWAIFNLLLVVLFGILHQGGVVPSLFRVHEVIYDRSNGTTSHDFRVVYWKTYLPPRHLLAVKNEDVDSKAVEILSYGRVPSERIMKAFQKHPPSHKPLSTLLVAPIFAVQQLGECVTERARIFPHLDLDQIGEAAQVGWMDRLSLGIFDVDRDCLGVTLEN